MIYCTYICFLFALWGLLNSSQVDVEDGDGLTPLATATHEGFHLHMASEIGIMTIQMKVAQLP
jgi:hypothetical protein